jgi:hypothetical protein
VEGLKLYIPFAQKVEELKKISKLSDRIKSAIEYNKGIEGTSSFKVLADDINILNDVVNVETISKENKDLCEKLESTDMFKTLINKYSESE